HWRAGSDKLAHPPVGSEPRPASSSDRLSNALMTDVFTSSDTVRASGPSRHLKTLQTHKPLQLELGGELPDVTIGYETYGTLSPNRDNAVLICHALSGDSHVARHDEADNPGWWDLVVGPGKAIDTNRYFVICSNILGGC